MKLSENVMMLEVTVPRGEATATIYPTLYASADKKTLALFDTGFPGTAYLVADAISAAGYDPRELTDIVLTHQDVDHIGGVNEFRELAPEAVVSAFDVDADFIEGKKTPTKLAKQQALKDAGEPYDEGFYDFLSKGFKTSFTPVDERLTDGELLFDGAIQVVATPGHTPGHAAFYLPADRLMIVGDAANITPDGNLTGSNPRMTWDLTLAEQSLERIKSFDSAGIISYHTGYLARA